MVSNYQKDMYRQMEELFAEVDKLKEQVESLTNVVKMLRTENTHLMEKLQTTESAFEAEKKKNAVLTAKDEELEAKNALLSEENTRLKEEVSHLKSNANNDSSNSSNPPSSDQKGAKKANEYNSRRKTDKKKGAQQGRKGKTLTKATAEELIASGKCRHTICEHGDKRSGRYTVKYEMDIDVSVVVIEHRIYDSSAAPAMPDSEVFYGNKVKALTGMLYTVGAVSVERMKELLSSITDGILNLSAGALYGFCRKLSMRAKSTLAPLENHLLNQKSVYTDATHVSVDGKQAYVRNISCPDAVRYYAMQKKDLPALREIGLLNRYAGTLVHDHETTLYHFGLRHGECNVHLLRYLLKNTEDCSTKWSGEMTELLYEMKRRREGLIAEGKTQFSEEELREFYEKYDGIIAKGIVENETTQPKWAKKEEKALLNRLEKYKENHLLFLRDFDVGFSNNMSERDLRKCKNRQKLTGGFRNHEGLTMFADLLSIVETAKRRKMCVFHTLLAVLNSGAPAIAF